jgi:hypothetical protein
MPPSKKRFNAEHRKCVESDLWLVMKLELPCHERMA